MTIRHDRETLRFQRLKIPVVYQPAHKPLLRIPRVLPILGGDPCRAHFQERGFTRAIWFANDHSNVHRSFSEGFSVGWTQSSEILVLSDLVPVRQRNDGKPFTTIVGKWLKCIPKPVAILTYNDEVPVLKLVERQSTNIMPVDDSHLDHAFKLLVADIAHPPSVSELAETVGISRSTLDRLFLRKLGRPQHDEL